MQWNIEPVANHKKNYQGIKGQTKTADWHKQRKLIENGQNKFSTKEGSEKIL